MSRFTSAVLSLVIMSGVSVAQDVPLEIKGGNVRIIEVDRTIIVKDKRALVQTFPFDVKAGGEGFFFWVVPQGVAFTDEGDTLKIASSPKGNLTIRVKVFSAEVVDGKIKYLTRTGSITFAVGDVVPDPAPPKPDPTPPGPVTGSLWIIIIEETNDATPGRGAWFADKELDAEIKAKGHRWRVADKDVKNADGQPPRDLAPWLDRAKGKGLPWLFITPAAGPQAGKMLHDGPLPANPAALVALLRKIGG